MRVAFDSKAFVIQSYGGVSRYYTKLAIGLLNNNHEVKIFAPLHRNRYLKELPQEIANGNFIDKYPPKTGWIFDAYNDYMSTLQIEGWRPNVVHETYYSKNPIAPNGCPTVITIHDMIHELFPNEFTFNDKTARNKRRAVDRADHVICVSENTKNDLMRLYGTSENKLSVIHHGFDKFSGNKNSFRPIEVIPRPFLLYVGQRAGYKNFDRFLKCVAFSSRLMSDFDIVAFGGSKFSSYELSLIKSLGFKANQVRHIIDGDNALGALYSAAQAFIYPSLYEGFGIPPLEAMANFCPVISSNTSSMPEIIGNAGEFFDPYEVDDMTRAIEMVVYSNVTSQVLREKGVTRLMQYSWNKCVSETIGIYQKFIST